MAIYIKFEKKVKNVKRYYFFINGKCLENSKK